MITDDQQFSIVQLFALPTMPPTSSSASISPATPRFLMVLPQHWPKSPAMSMKSDTRYSPDTVYPQPSKFPRKYVMVDMPWWLLSVVPMGTQPAPSTLMP